MSHFWETVLAFAQETTAQVGKQLLADFGTVQASEKTDGSLITRSDQWADRELVKLIKSTFPSHGILSEEGEHLFPENDWCWIIDPVDGTTNFARGIPIWAISLALFYRGQPVFGYIHLPPLNQSFHGFWYDKTLESNPDFPQPTIGAFLNHHPISTRDDSPGSNQFFSFCSRSIPWIEHPFPCKIRMLGVASYNFLSVAAGWTLGAVEATPKIWDFAGVWPILHAAGGVWVPLESDSLFPLAVGKDYSQQSFPALVVSREDWVPVFQPLIKPKK